MTDQSKTLHVTIETGKSYARREKKSTRKKGSKNGQAGMTSRLAGDGPVVLQTTVEPKLPIDKLSRLLSERNIDLLRMIKTAQPESVAELARLSGRPKASLTLTLRRLERFGIVVFKSAGGRRKIPTVVCDRLMLEVAIVP